jgi:hypothetical protein
VPRGLTCPSRMARDARRSIGRSDLRVISISCHGVRGLRKVNALLGGASLSANLRKLASRPISYVARPPPGRARKRQLPGANSNMRLQAEPGSSTTSRPRPVRVPERPLFTERDGTFESDHQSQKRGQNQRVMQQDQIGLDRRHGPVDWGSILPPARPGRPVRRVRAAQDAPGRSGLAQRHASCRKPA